MSYLIHIVHHIVSLVPGIAARTHRPCGRMRNALRVAMATIGLVFMMLAALCVRATWRGFDEGRFGYFPAALLGLVVVFLLIDATGVIMRALRNPAPAPLPDNVIPFHRPVPANDRDLRRYRRRFDA